MIESTQGLMTMSKPTNPGFDRGAGSGLLKDILVKCARCRALLYVRDWERNFKICQECGYHFRLSAAERIASLLDGGSFVEADTQLQSSDPLHFVSQSTSYPDKLVEEQRRTGLNEAVMSGTGRIGGHAIAL